MKKEAEHFLFVPLILTDSRSFNKSQKETRFDSGFFPAGGCMPPLSPPKPARGFNEVGQSPQPTAMPQFI
ncbi:MAG: hypothetical protein Q8K86_08555 [Candidatus Nanopelagicaceae bacterium]|nr:hypothetical protein [Candidatus Nanopelagicaceae bacterium]